MYQHVSVLEHYTVTKVQPKPLSIRVVRVNLDELSCPVECLFIILNSSRVETQKYKIRPGILMRIGELIRTNICCMNQL